MLVSLIKVIFQKYDFLICLPHPIPNQIKYVINDVTTVLLQARGSQAVPRTNCALEGAMNTRKLMSRGSCVPRKKRCTRAVMSHIRPSWSTCKKYIDPFHRWEFNIAFVFDFYFRLFFSFLHFSFVLRFQTFLCVSQIIIFYTFTFWNQIENQSLNLRWQCRGIALSDHLARE
jgi:hypothetical protein